MKRLFSIATGVLALGVTAAAPSFARADHRHEERVERREVRAERYRDERRWEEHRWHGWDRERVHVGVGIDVGGPIYVDRRPVYVDERPVYVNNDCDLSVALCDVPQRVLDTVRCEAPGRIESARLIRRDGFEFYRVEVDARGGDLLVRVDCGGHLLGIDRC